MTDTIEPRRFIVIGAGGVGGWLLSGLLRMAEYKAPGSAVIIVDGDTFEPKNAERQEFGSIGNKAVVRAEEYQPQFANTFVIPDTRWVVEELPERIGEEDSEDESVAETMIAASELLEDGDIVYATVDNFAARKAVFDAARYIDNIDVFTGGNDENLFGSVYHYARRNGDDVTDHPAEVHTELENPPDRNPGELSCQERAELEGSTQTIAANMAVASYLLGRTHKVIFEGQEDKECEINFDLGLGLAQPTDRTVDTEEEAAVETKEAPAGV